MMKMPVATATPTSGYSRCHAGTAGQGPRITAKDRGGGLVRLANASAPFPHLAHFACPSCPSCRNIVGAALCCRSGPQVRQWGEMQGDPTGGLGSLVLCWLRWPAGMWGHFFVFNSGRRWAARCGAARSVHVDRLGRCYVAGLRRWGKCMLPALLLIIPCAHLSISSDSRHSLLSSTCPSSHTLHVHTHLSRARIAPCSLPCRLAMRGFRIS